MITAKRGSPLEIIAPDDATTLRVAGEGHSASADVADGAATFDTSEFPVGRYQSEWEFSDGRLSVGPKFVVDPSLKQDGIKDAGLTYEERMLAAAKKTLEVASGSTDISFSVDSTNYSFESRGDLLAYVNRLESKVKRMKQPIRKRRWYP